jgi:DNA-binding MarR family transcriptional regulator
VATLRQRASFSRPDARAKGDPLTRGFLLGNSPFYLMARAYSRYTHVMEDSLRAIGMDLPRWRILMVVHERNPSSISEIADQGVLRLSTMTRVAQRLATDGLVKLATRKDDARITQVFITPRGRAAVEQVRIVASGIYNRAFEQFKPAEIAILTDVLRRIFGTLAAFRPAPAPARAADFPSRSRS